MNAQKINNLNTRPLNKKIIINKKYFLNEFENGQMRCAHTW